MDQNSVFQDKNRYPRMLNLVAKSINMNTFGFGRMNCMFALGRSKLVQNPVALDTLLCETKRTVD